VRTKDSRVGRLRLAILDDSRHVVQLLCDWCRQHGHRCATRMVAEMAHAHVLKWAVCTTAQTSERYSDKIKWEDNSHWHVALELVSSHSTQRQKGHLCFALSVLRSVSC
jgi:hypothetical protein